MTTAQQNTRRGSARSPKAAEGELDTLKDEVGTLAGTAVQRGWGFVEAARSHATDYAAQRKDDAARSVGEFAGAVRASGESFNDLPNIRAVIDSAAEGLDHLSTSIGERSFAEMYAEAETVARRSPAAAAVAGAVAGFLVARIIKASSDTIRRMPADVGREVSRAAGGPARRQA